MIGGPFKREAIAWVSMAAILLAAGTAMRRLHVLQEQLRAARVAALRTETQDRLVGTKVRIDTIGRPGRQTSRSDSILDKSTVVWILDLERCDKCLAGIAEWERLERMSELNPQLIIIGDPTPTAAAYLRTLSRTNISHATRATVFATLGPLLPVTKMLIDQDGIAVSVDSRLSGQDCAWSFEAQLAYFLGTGAASSIRLRAGE